MDMSYFFLKREGADGLSPNFALQELDYEHAVRATRARHFDCLDAFEITYIGPFEWSTGASVAGAGLGFLPFLPRLRKTPITNLRSPLGLLKT